MFLMSWVLRSGFYGMPLITCVTVTCYVSSLNVQKTLIHLVINLLRRFAKNKEVCFDRWDSGDLKTFPCILNSITVKFHFMQI